MRRAIRIVSLFVLVGVAQISAQALPADSLFDRWLDNTGASAFDAQGIGRGKVTSDSIPFEFHYTPTDNFHTTFVYTRATDSWQWHMDNDSSGVRRPFVRVTLTRR